jgi:hypothetical protein
MAIRPDLLAFTIEMTSPGSNKVKRRSEKVNVPEAIPEGETTSNVIVFPG